MTESPDLAATQSTASDDEINLLDLLIVLARYKKLILGLPFVVAVIAIGYSLSLHNIYTASTKILPPQQSQSVTASMLAQLGGIVGLAGGTAGIRGPNDLYIGMLKSRTVADNLIQRFGLMELWEIDAKHRSDAYKQLDGITNIASGKEGIITIEVDDKDPKRAAEIANAYVDELLKLTQVLAVTEASRRRLFFERQLAQTKDNLTKSEISARRALAQGGLVKVDDQGRAMVEATARLRAQITAKEVQIGAMRTFAADRNPDLLLARQELESMKHELAKIEEASGVEPMKDGRGSKGIDNLGLLRDVKYQEVLFELLAKQYELAKIEEAKDSAVVQVMDKAIAPDRKSKPKRGVIVMLSTLAAGFIAVLWAFVREAFARAGSNPQQAARLQAIRRHLAWR